MEKVEHCFHCGFLHVLIQSYHHVSGKSGGLWRWTLSIWSLRKSFGRKTGSMQMWKPYNVPEPCKWRSKKINAALYPFLMLCLCMKCKEHYQNLKHFYIWVYIKWSHFYKVKNSELQERLFLKQSDRCLKAKGKPNCWHGSSYLWLVLGGWAVRPVSQSVCRVKKKHVYLIPSLLGGNER